MDTEHDLDFLPKKLKFFLELHTKRKSGGEIYEFLTENIGNMSEVNLIMKYLIQNQEWDFFCLAIDAIAGTGIDVDYMLALSDLPMIHLLNDAQRSALITRLETMQARLPPSKNATQLKRFWEKLKMGPIQEEVKAAEDVPTRTPIEELKANILEKKSFDVKAILASLEPTFWDPIGKWLEILNLSIEHGMLELAREVLNYLEDEELLIYFNQLAYGISVFPQPEDEAGTGFYTEFKRRIPAIEEELEEVSDRFMSADNLTSILAANILTTTLRPLYQAIKIESYISEASSSSSAPDASDTLLSLLYGSRVSQALFKQVQTNISKQAALKLSDDPLRFNLENFMNNIYKARMAIVSKADPLNLLQWSSRHYFRSVLRTPIGPRYFPYYQKILDAAGNPANRDFLQVTEDALTICYKKDEKRIPLTSYTQENQWRHTDSIHFTQIKKILEENYQTLLAKRPFPSNETEFREQFLPEIASCHWLLAHCCPYTRGSAFVAEVVTKALCYHFGFECSFEGWMPDCEALVTPNPTEFVKIFAETIRLTENKDCCAVMGSDGEEDELHLKPPCN